MNTLASTTPAAPAASAAPRAQARRGAPARWLALALETHISLPLFALCLLGAMWFGTLHVIEAERRAAAAAARDATHELLDTYEAQMARSLSNIDQTLRVLKYAVEQNGPAGALPALAAKGLLPPGLVFQVEISDSHGRVVASNPDVGPRDLAGASYFEFHRHSRHDQAYVSQAITHPGAAEPHLHFTRRIDDAAGRFAGVAVVAVDPAYFTSSYERSRQGERGLLGLVGNDGVVRALRVGEQVSWGQSYTPGPTDMVACAPAASMARRATPPAGRWAASRFWRWPACRKANRWRAFASSGAPGCWAPAPAAPCWWPW